MLNQSPNGLGGSGVVMASLKEDDQYYWDIFVAAWDQGLK